METNPPAEELPALYRAILDRVAELEAAGERARAARLRTDATDAYSKAWDERARRRLETLLRRSEPESHQGHGGRVRRPVSSPQRAMATREH
ncbi:MAG TPA: hypothetical protein VK867_07655 [Candidatus Limnocylindrales bacterium]|nr:hypothetical protein [Candidatus Limnocylindrales bacterium]